jgi:1,4-dihydroxy-2-naphthoate octaprenyltransferase
VTPALFIAVVLFVEVRLLMQEEERDNAVRGLAILAAGALLGLLAVPLAIAPCRRVLGGASGQALIPVLAATGRLQLAFGLAATVGLAIGA